MNQEEYKEKYIQFMRNRKKLNEDKLRVLLTVMSACHLQQATHPYLEAMFQSDFDIIEKEFNILVHEGLNQIMNHITEVKNYLEQTYGKPT